MPRYHHMSLYPTLYFLTDSYICGSVAVAIAVDDNDDDSFGWLAHLLIRSFTHLYGYESN